jgi:erythromycin esterase
MRIKRALWSLPLLLGAPACGSDAAAPPNDAPPIIHPDAIAWLNQTVVPFRTDVADDDFSDLEPLKVMIGDAQVVALGEATHGTREFFRMKDRVLRFLVQEMDFNAFAIEASWPELNRIDDFVHTGVGDPEVLLSGQYFWTWRTQEVMDMLLWVRAYNQTPGIPRPVSFVGFDMQFPGMGIHNVEEFLRAIDPAALTFASEQLACMLPFANGPDGSGNKRDYENQTAQFQNMCRAALEALFDYLLQRRDELIAASSEHAFEHALQSLRTVIQFEDMGASRTFAARDYHMAQNTLWILDHLGPGTKLVVWAHNFHISDRFPSSQGGHLRRELGDDYVNLAFSFWQGTATAVQLNPPGPLGPTAMPRPPADSYEAHFRAADAERFLLDLRGVAFDTPATQWLAGARAFREIGCCLNVSNPSTHIMPLQLPSLYDVVIFFERTNHSVLLPFRPPASF